MAQATPFECVVQLQGRSASEEQLINLAQELRLVPGVRASPAAGQPPAPGTKGFAETPLALVLAGVANGLPNILKTLGDWLSRQPPTTSLRFKVGDLEMDWNGSTPPESLVAAMTATIEKRNR